MLHTKKSIFRGIPGLRKKAAATAMFLVMAHSTAYGSERYADPPMQASDTTDAVLQTASMMMYDNIPLLMHSGRLDLSIPLIHFEDPDFECPVSLRYNSEGFRPSAPDNYTGRDWSLEAGGLIYREIKGKPDDLMRISPGTERTSGFLQTARSGKYDPEDVRAGVLGGDPARVLGLHFEEGNAVAFKGDGSIDNGYKDEFSSDIYHFRAGRHSGKFMIDFDGNVIVSGNDSGNRLSTESIRTDDDRTENIETLCIQPY